MASISRVLALCHARSGEQVAPSPLVASLAVPARRHLSLAKEARPLDPVA